MTKERLTIEIDAGLMARLRAAGLDPIAYAERVLAQSLIAREMQSERTAREGALRREMQPGLDAYDAFIEERGLWSDELRQF